MIAALFVQKNGAYYGLPDVDPWDIERDARLYAGPWSVVAHPPCTRWCQLAHVVEARYGHKVGDDGGCFESALASVRAWGGVLEHPAESIAWRAFKLARPRRGAWSLPDAYGGRVCEVSQRAYGHRARKRTWLYAVSAAPLPALDWASPPAIATVSFMTNHGGGKALIEDESARLLPTAMVGRMRQQVQVSAGDALPRLSKKEASASPPAFRDVLLNLARTAGRKRVVA